jgi:hypothetical protein
VDVDKVLQPISDPYDTTHVDPNGRHANILSQSDGRPTGPERRS